MLRNSFVLSQLMSMVQIPNSSGSTEGSRETEIWIEAALWACPCHDELKNSQVMGNTIKLSDFVHYCCSPLLSGEFSLCERGTVITPKWLGHKEMYLLLEFGTVDW